MKHQKKAFIRIISVTLITAMLFSVTAFSGSASSVQDQIDELESKINANNNKISDNKASVNDLLNQISDMQAQLDVYNAKITDLNKQIAAKDEIINNYQAEIDRLQAEIDAANIQIETQTAAVDVTYDVLKARLRSAYKAGESSALEVLLSSGDYASFLTRLELLKRVSEHDNELVKGLQDEINELNKTKEQLSSDQQSQQEKQSEIVNEKAAIESARAEVKSVYNTLDAKQSRLEAQVKSLNSIVSSLESQNAMSELELQSIKNTNGSSGNGVLSSGMSFPLTCKYYVSQHYSYDKEKNPHGHKGVDIAGANINGQPVYAAAGGTVISASYHSSWGNNVLIDHGNGVWTRYAHLSSIGVSAGQTVSQGQYIGKVGSTGNSSGPHLHFEVYVNKNRVNPEPYIGL